MTKAKDYILDIYPTPEEADTREVNLIKFTVKKRPGYFQEHVRVPLVSMLMVFLAIFLGRLLYTFKLSSSMSQLSTRFVDSFHQSNFSSMSLTLLANRIPRAWAKYNEELSMFVNGAMVLFLVLLIVVISSRQDEIDLMIVIKDLGIQLNSTGKWKFMNILHRSNNIKTDPKGNKNFIPLSNIIDLVIHEGFHSYGQVIYYMCILTRNSKEHTHVRNGTIIQNSSTATTLEAQDEGETPIKVVFPQLLPRHDILLEVWKQSRRILYGDRTRYWRRVPGQGLRPCVD